MLISPLMGPMMATGLALAAGHLYLGIKAVTNLLVSIAVSIAFSALLVWLLPFNSATSKIVSRTNPSFRDLGIAFFSGLAGSVVVCRGKGDGVTALPGAECDGPVNIFRLSTMEQTSCEIGGNLHTPIL
jgi:uncharacterized hydrophobic protein (TIGR00271 family)